MKIAKPRIVIKSGKLYRYNTKLVTRALNNLLDYISKHNYTTDLDFNIFYIDIFPYFNGISFNISVSRNKKPRFYLVGCYEYSESILKMYSDDRDASPWKIYL